MSQTMTTSKGVVVRTGQTYTDRRESNRRTLRVVRIEEPRRSDQPDDARVTLIVDLVDGKPPARPRNTMTTAGRLAGRDFIQVEPPASGRCAACAGTGDSNGADWCEECAGTGWVGLDDEDTSDDVCPDCGSPECVCPPEIAYRQPVTDVFLPGDGPARSNPRTVVASA